MYEIGDKVTIKSCNPQKVGEIILWHYDEGNIWTVELSDGRQEDFGDHELAPATDAYGHPWSSQEKEWNKTEDILQDRYPLQGG